MALAFTVRSRPLRASGSGLAARGAFGVAAVLVAAWTCLALLLEDVVRLVLPAGGAASAAQLLGPATGLACLGLAIGAWVDQRHDPWLLLTASLAPIVIALRLVATALLLDLEQATLAELTDAALVFIGVALAVWTAVAAVVGRAGTPGRGSIASALLASVLDVVLLTVLVANLAGSAVRAVGASWACQGFPGCNGLGLLPLGRDPIADVQLAHRLLAYLAVALVAWVTLEALRPGRHPAVVRNAVLVLAGATLLEGAAGAASVLPGAAPLLQAVHSATAVLAWTACVAAAALAHRVPAVAVALDTRVPGPAIAAPAAASAVGRAPASAVRSAEPPTTEVPGTRPAPLSSKLAIVSAYVQLTKPRVMSLLLATTAAAMVIAARGLPNLGLFAWTMLGGALMSGGAGAINHYVDRDIDPLMGRTAWRPIPSGVIAPHHALGFGIVLGLIATLVFVVFVNPLAAVLAILGLLGYVFIYTLWLKRSTPSNIVIGGAAGAIPPLVGWAAVTHEIGSLTAWYLFAIIFFWTPPHFWTLSLLIRQHYERAGVPMLPVVRGDDETRRQIVLYSLVLVGLSLVLSPFGMMGLLYFVAAIVLGAAFLYLAIRLWQQATRAAARRLYLYSLLYLFVLFAAMAVDRSL